MPSIDRRTFLLTGAAGTAALGLAWWMHGRHPRAGVVPRTLDGNARAIVTAIVPVMLEGVLPSERSTRIAAVRETVDGVATAVSGLPPAAQDELQQLFALLDWAPTRFALARITTPWRDADPIDVADALESWRTSRVDLMRSAYDAFHQLVFAAWYGNPRSWVAIGYGGPPALS